MRELCCIAGHDVAPVLTYLSLLQMFKFILPTTFNLLGGKTLAQDWRCWHKPSMHSVTLTGICPRVYKEEKGDFKRPWYQGKLRYKILSSQLTCHVPSRSFTHSKHMDDAALCYAGCCPSFPLLLPNSCPLILSCWVPLKEEKSATAKSRSK